MGSKASTVRKVGSCVILSGLVFGLSARLLGQGVPSSEPKRAINYKLGNEVIASNNPDGGFLRCEPSIAMHQDRLVVAWNDSWGGKQGASTGVAVGWAYSTDRGRSFKFGGYLPTKSDEIIPSGADSWLVVDQAGNFFLQVLSWQAKKTHLQVYSMPATEFGKWTKLPDAAVADQAKGDAQIDKPAMAIDDSGRLGVAYSTVGSGQYRIFVTTQDSRGDRWRRSIEVSASAAERVRIGAAIVMSGSEVVVTWMEGRGVSLTEVWGAVSKDGGKRFDEPALIKKLKEPVAAPKGYQMGNLQAAFISNNTWLATAHRTQNKADYYLAFAEGRKNGSDIKLLKKTAGAASWEKIAVGTDGSGTGKIFPSVALLKKNVPAVLYYDRPDPSSTVTNVWLSVGPKNIQLNTVGSDWAKVPGDKDLAPIQQNFGDYITLAAFENVLAAAWTDGRNGRPTIYVRTVTIE
ncbi:MAG: hypothetical protein AB7J13_07140 [Pyrinomonadaceae bacterium]